MKAKFFTVTFLFFIALAITSCHKPPDDNDGNNNDTTVIDTCNLSFDTTLLTKYSWKECKYMLRLSDSTLYDNSYYYLSEECDTEIITFISDQYYKQRVCTPNPIIYFWKYLNCYTYYGLYFQQNDNEPETLFKIEELTEDTLKVFLVDIDNPEELVAGNIIYYHAIPKKSYKK